jgi:hypothetical protein
LLIEIVIPYTDSHVEWIEKMGQEIRSKIPGSDKVKLKLTPLIQSSHVTKEKSPSLRVPSTSSVDGGRLSTIDEVRTWLAHPSNQRETQLFIIGWEGHVPYVSKNNVVDLSRDSFCRAVIYEQRQRRDGRTLHIVENQDGEDRS